MANGKAWRFKFIENLKIHALMTLLSYRIESKELKAYLRKPKGENETEL